MNLGVGPPKDVTVILLGVPMEQIVTRLSHGKTREKVSCFKWISSSQMM